MVAVVITFGVARQTMKKKASTATEMRENNNVCYSACTVLIALAHLLLRNDVNLSVACLYITMNKTYKN